MTQRRDVNVRGGNVIKGFRMEPDLARRLTAYARVNFAGDDGRADLAHAARSLLRAQLGISPELDSGPLPVTTRGMKVEVALNRRIETHARDIDLGVVGTIRHLLRIALGILPSESLARERHFAMIAEMRRAEGA